jgi:mannose-6-phosphate isomerase-like protein (cupin superfamily)
MPVTPANIPTAPEPIIVVNAPLPQRPPNEPLTFLQPDEMQWRKMIPSMGENSPKIAVLRHVRQSGATTLLIWTPPNFHVPRHWHSGNEKHMVVSGTFIMECEGKRVVMKAGTYNYMPARMVHQAWTPADDPCLLLTDVDTLWDVNWIDPPPSELPAPPEATTV